MSAKIQHRSFLNVDFCTGRLQEGEISQVASICKEAEWRSPWISQNQLRAPEACAGSSIPNTSSYASLDQHDIEPPPTEPKTNDANSRSTADNSPRPSEDIESKRLLQTASDFQIIQRLSTQRSHRNEDQMRIASHTFFKLRWGTGCATHHSSLPAR